MKYEDYFIRVQDHQSFEEKYYEQEIVSYLGKNEKERSLFSECFSNHIEFKSPSTDQLNFDKTSTSRYIQKNNLSAYFINEIYKPPKLYAVTQDVEIDYDAFIGQFLEHSFYSNPDSNFSLGGNRIRFIVGNVGEGKSAFIQKVYCDIERKCRDVADDYRVVSLYINLEKEYNYGEEPKPIKETFEQYLFNRIFERLQDLGINIEVIDVAHLNPYGDPSLGLKLLLAKLKKNKIRLIIYIDNLDFYHYYYSRYAYFDEGYKKQEESINDNIGWLISLFISMEKLGNQGLNVMIPVRQHIFDGFIAGYKGVDTETNTNNTMQAIKLGKVSPEVVIGSRLQLLSQAIKAISNAKPSLEKSMNDSLYIIQLALMGNGFYEKREDKSGEGDGPLANICKLCQHGNRSMVQFLSSMNLASLDQELIDRFFGKQVSTLYILYINKMYRRYSQSKDHFPNLFLNDCMVLPEHRFRPAHQPHYHTYWLKYLMLKMINNSRNLGVKFINIVEMFTEAGFQDHLVRHVIGSLGTSNEFCCIRSDKSWKRVPYYGQKLYSTERGAMLLREHNSVEFCFEFECLGSIIEDRWLSFPMPIFGKIYDSNPCFDHLYKSGSEYIEASVTSVMKKAAEILWFIRVIQVEFDIDFGPSGRYCKLADTIRENDLKPDFNAIRKNILNSAKRLCNSFMKRDTSQIINRLYALEKEIMSERMIEEFYVKYKKSDVMVNV